MANSILVGQILAAHGIKGEVKIKSFTEDPLSLCDYGPVMDEQNKTTYQIKITGVQHNNHGGALIAKIKGITDRNAAEQLARSKPKLYVTRDQLPELEKGRYYIEDLKGFSAVSEKGKALATLKDVQNYGAGDIAVLQLLEGPENKREFMLPFHEPYVGKVDVKKRTIKIMIPPGWLADEKPPQQDDDGEEAVTAKPKAKKKPKAETT